MLDSKLCTWYAVGKKDIKKEKQKTCIDYQLLFTENYNVLMRHSQHA